MNRPRKSLYLCGALLTLYSGYLLVGYRYLTSQLCTSLVIYCLHPNGLPKVWSLMIFPRALCRHALFSKRPRQIRREFAYLHNTLYTGSMIYIDSPPSRYYDSRQWRKAIREFTVFFYHSGVGLGTNWVDQDGCTAIHDALIARDAYSAEYLVKLGNVNGDLRNPQATDIEHYCRLSIRALARTEGIRLTFGSSSAGDAALNGPHVT